MDIIKRFSKTVLFFMCLSTAVESSDLEMHDIITLGRGNFQYDSYVTDSGVEVKRDKYLFDCMKNIRKYMQPNLKKTYNNLRREFFLSELGIAKHYFDKRDNRTFFILADLMSNPDNHWRYSAQFFIDFSPHPFIQFICNGQGNKKVQDCVRDFTFHHLKQMQPFPGRESFDKNLWLARLIVHTNVTRTRGSRIAALEEALLHYEGLTKDFIMMFITLRPKLTT